MKQHEIIRNGKTRNEKNARQEIKRILMSLENLPSLPSVATQVLSMTLDEDMDMDRIARMIESDQSLTLRILKLVNSASYGLNRKISNVGQAIVILGLSAVKCALLSISIRDCFIKGAKADSSTHRELWKHSLACAVSAELLSERTYPQLKDEAFAGGLLHDIGKVVIQTCLPYEYEKISEKGRYPNGSSLEAEQEILNLDHTLVGKWLAQKWNLSSDLVSVIWLHHQHIDSLASLDVNRELVYLVMLADLLAHDTLVDYKKTYIPDAYYQGLLKALSLDVNDVEKVKALMGKRFAERAGMFDLESDEVNFYFEALQRANMKLGSMTMEVEKKNDILGQTNRILYVNNEVGLKLAKAKGVQEVLTIVLDALKGRLGVKGGLIYYIDRNNHLLEGKTWYEPGTVRNVHFFLNRDHEPIFDNEVEKLPQSVKEVISTYSSRIPTVLVQNKTSKQISYVEPYVTVGMVAKDNFLGELCIVRDPEESVKLTPQEYLGYSHIGSLAATALHRVRLYESLEEKSEELSTALWKNQQINLQLMQTERLAAVGQLAAGAAHEINNPLAIIYARAQLLQFKETEEKKRQELKQITEQIERISSILTNLMGFARPAPPKLETISLHELLDKTVLLVQGGLKTLRICINKDYSTDIPQIKGDANQLEQVFLNLLINAEHAMEQKGGELRIATTMREDGKHVLISISDQGVGIPKENLVKIFDPFFTTKEEGKGTGLGLSTSYGIINNHYGTFNVQSEVGVGTTVTVELPIDIESLRPAKAQEAEVKSVSRINEAPAVLVVDDEQHIRDILKEALEGEGLKVDTAANGQEGLEKLSTKDYRLLLLDIRMPVRSGLSVLSEIKDLVQQMPVVVLTGLASHEEMEEALAMGAYKCIRKPFHIKQLLKDIHEILEKESPAEASP